MDSFPARALLFMHPSILFLLLFQPSLDYGFVWTDQGGIEHGGGARLVNCAVSRD